MVWSKISIGGHTDLHIIWNDTLTVQPYADEILRLYVVHYAAVVGYSCLLMHNNARFLENML